MSKKRRKKSGSTKRVFQGTVSFFKKDSTKRALPWVLSVFFILAAIGAFPSASSILLFLAGVICLPVRKLQDFFAQKGLHGKIKVILVAVLFLVSMTIFPSGGNSSSDINSTDATMEEQVSETLPSVENQNEQPVAIPSADTTPSPEPSEPAETAPTDTPEPVDETQEPEVEVAVETETPVEAETLAVDDGIVHDGHYTLSSGLNLDFIQSVQNDTTGNWRLSTISDNLMAADYALDYYETMFTSDDEVHAIYNSTLGTVTRIAVWDGLLYVDTLAYVTGGENDADLLCSGEILNRRATSIETGETYDYTEEYLNPSPSPTPTPAPEASEPMVWIPTKGGTKYHKKSTCSGMDGPEQVTISEAEARGFTPCKKCYG